MKIQSYSYPGCIENNSYQQYLDRYDLGPREEVLEGSFEGEDFYVEDLGVALPQVDGTALLKQAQELKQNIFQCSESDLSSREELLKELERIFRILDSGVDLPDLRQGLATKLANLESQFVDDLLNHGDEEGLHSPGAQTLASALGIDPEEVEGLASQHQVNLENLASTPHDAMVRFILSARNHLKDVLTEVEQAIVEKKSQDDEMVLRANVRNMTAQSSTGDVDDMNFAPFQYLWLAQKGEDDESQNIQTKLTQLTEKINESLSGLEGNFHYRPDEISDLLGIDIPNPPELVPIAIDAKNRGRYEKYAPAEFYELIGQGYPYYSYQGTFQP